MNEDAVTEKLAAALTAMWEADAGEPLDDLDVFAETRDEYVAALLPVVREIVAEELRAAADELGTRAVELWSAYKSGPPSDPRRASPHTEGESDGWENAGTHVRARADNLASGVSPA